MKLATANMVEVETHQKVSEGDFVSWAMSNLTSPTFIRRKYGLDNSYGILRMYRNRFYRKRMEKVRRKYERAV